MEGKFASTKPAQSSRWRWVAPAAQASLFGVMFAAGLSIACGQAVEESRTRSVPSHVARRLPPSVEHGSAGRSDSALALVAKRAQSRIDRGVELARHGAICAARDEFVVALEMIGHARDSEQRSQDCHRAIVSGLTAFDEADDFVRTDPLASKSGIRGIVAAHRTPVLKNVDVDAITPPIAICMYCEYASQQLALACHDVPTAARALFALGRIEAAMGRDIGTPSVGCPKAMVLFETAVQIDPQHHEAANELGVLLARYGQMDRAAAVLEKSVRAKPTAEGYYNLSVVYREMSLPREADAALAQSRYLGRIDEGAKDRRDAPVDIRIVDLATFQERSPPEPVLDLNRPAVRSDSEVVDAAAQTAASPPTRLRATEPTSAGESRPASGAGFRRGSFLGSLLGKRNQNSSTTR